MANIKQVKIGSTIYDVQALGVISVTHSELVSLRDGGNLIPGVSYRITDYVCSESGDEYKSVNNQYDIILIADSNSTLNRNARATWHSGSGISSSVKVSEWRLVYDIDLGTKGKVLWLHDEYDNEAYYDFKNVQFKRYKVLGLKSGITITSGIVDTYLGFNPNGLTDLFVIDSNDYKWVYTFGGETDRSLDGNCAGNHIGKGYYGQLSNITFLGGCTDNHIDSNNYINSFGANVGGNHIGEYAIGNIICDSCAGNYIENNAWINIIANSSQRNHIGGNFNANVLNIHTDENIIGAGCSGIIFTSPNSKNNKIGNRVQANRLSTITCSTIGNGVRGCILNYEYEVKYLTILDGTASDGLSDLTLSGIAVGANVNYPQVCGLDSSGNYVHKAAIS